MNRLHEIKRSISFGLEKRKDAKGESITVNVPIRMTVTYNSQRVTFYAGYRVDASKWNADKQRAKGNTSNEKGQTAQHINNKLDSLSAGVNEYFKQCEVRRHTPTADELKEEFKGLTTGKKSNAVSFFQTFDEFVKAASKENDWSESTIKKFTTLKNHLQAFDARLSFDTLNDERGGDLVHYFRHTKDFRNTYIAKSLKFLKWFLRWAKKKKHPVQDAILDYNPNLKGTDGKIKKVIFLTREELMHVYHLKIPATKQYLERVRDAFCFCCFSGLRYIDLFHLKKADDKGDLIEFVPVKEPETLYVQLNKYSRAILDKYKDVPFPNDKALPVISNQKMNEYLKELAEMAELNSQETFIYYKGSRRIEETYPKHELLTTHCARKTFITNLIYLGVADAVIKEWTGHKDNRSYDSYHKVVNEIKAREMAKFNDF